jgi:hypothetical protein
MATLTQTRIDIADRHTTLCAFSDGNNKKAAPQLPLGTAKGYTDLYSQAVDTKVPYASLQGGKPGQILKKVFRVYGPEKYWKRYLDGTEPTPSAAWSAGLPLLGGLNKRIELILPAGFNAKVSPVPQVLLYPFGWSTWISLRIVGEHTLDDLGRLVDHLFRQKSFQIAGAAQPVALQTVLDTVSKGVRTDAFCGSATADSEGKSKAIVITVMEKHGGSLALGALSDDQEKNLRRIIRPEGKGSSQPFADLAFQLPGSEELDYLIIDDLGRFIWLEELLTPGPGDRNYKFLECYHHNSFRSLVQAWHFLGLLTQSAALGTKQPAPLKGLVKAARASLEEPQFKNASLVGFLKLNEVQKALQPKPADKQ